MCHGNICRSPMAEMIMKKMVADRGLGHLYHIESAATSTEEIGNDIYPPAKAELRRQGIPFTSRGAWQMQEPWTEMTEHVQPIVMRTFQD